MSGKYLAIDTTNRSFAQMALSCEILAGAVIGSKKIERERV